MQFHSKTTSEKFPCSLLFSGKWIPINKSTYRWNPVDILINTWVQTATIKKWWTGVLRPSNANSRMKIRSLPFCLHLFCGKENSFPRQNILTDSWFFCSGKERRFISKIWLFELLQIISSGIFTNISTTTTTSKYIMSLNYNNKNKNNEVAELRIRQLEVLQN